MATAMSDENETEERSSSGPLVKLSSRVMQISRAGLDLECSKSASFLTQLRYLGIFGNGRFPVSVALPMMPKLQQLDMHIVASDLPNDLRMSPILPFLGRSKLQNGLKLSLILHDDVQCQVPHLLHLLRITPGMPCLASLTIVYRASSIHRSTVRFIIQFVLMSFLIFVFEKIGTTHTGIVRFQP